MDNQVSINRLTSSKTIDASGTIRSTPVDLSNVQPGGFMSLQVALTGDGTAKIEYEHFDFGSTGIGVNHVAAATGVFSTTVVRSTERIDLVKGGINYRFNWGAPATY